VTDRRDLSRRKLLWAVATAGAAASAGSGTAAVMYDSEIVDSEMTAGMLDLDTDPSWANDSSFGAASKGDSGTETVTLSVSDNPSYLWFRTKCIQCDPVEEALFVRFGVDTDGDGDVERWLSDDYLSLRKARERFGEGVNLDEIEPTETWEFVVEWEIRENVRDDTNVDFDFDFYATQSRHVMNTDSVAPDWQCPSGCGGTVDGLSAISWVAFCSSSEFSRDDLDFERSDDKRTLMIKNLPDRIDTILLKYGTKLDVFGTDGSQDGQLSLTVGDGTSEYQDGNSYPGTEPLRSNSIPCPDSYGCKYEFPDEKGPGGWECKDSRDEAYGNNDRVGSVSPGRSSLDVDLTGGER